MILVSGEAGMGKTALAEEVAARAADDGFRVVWGTCSPVTTGQSFRPWVEALRGLVSAGPRTAAFTAASGHARLARLLDTSPGHLADPSASPLPAQHDDAQAVRVELFDQVAGLIRAVTPSSPLLLALEDMHLADALSVVLLSFLRPQLRTAPAVILVTCRTAGPDHGAPGAVAELSRVADLHVALRGLAETETAALADAAAGSALPGGVVRVIHRRSDGNPLFVRELARLLLGRPGSVEVSALVPETVRHVFTERLGALTPGCRALLGTAAVVGTSFGVDALAEVSGLGEQSPDVLDEAVRAGLVRHLGTGRAGFVHELARDVVYEELASAHQARLHRDVGAQLERLADEGRDVEPAELAHHFSRAGSRVDTVKAVRYAHAAGDRAIALLAYEEAVRHYEHALTLGEKLPGNATACGLLLALGNARYAAGEAPAARKAYRAAAVAARQRGRGDLLARAALGIGSDPVGFEVALLDREQLDLLEEARALIPDDAVALRAWICARLSVALSFTESARRRLDLAEEALRLALTAGDDAAMAYALAAHCDAIAGPDHCVERIEEASKVVALARRLGDRRLELLGRRLRLVALLETGDILGADAEVEAFAGAVAVLRQPRYAWYVPLWRGMRALVRGRVADCRRRLAEAERLGAAAGSENASALATTLRWCLLDETGERVELKRWLLEFERDAPGATWAVVAGALGCAQAGRVAEARVRLDSVVPGLREALRDSEWLPMLAQVAETVFLLGGHPAAAWTYEMLLPYRHLVVVEGIGAALRGSVERHLGLLAATLSHRDTATGHFASALEIDRRLGPLPTARTLRDAGMALGDQDRLAEAAALYQDLGIERRAHEFAARTASSRNLFRSDGEVWTLAFAGREVRLRDSKGLRDLARLLAQPGRAIAALDLIGGDVRSAGADEILDAQARAAYRQRLADLEDDIAEADAMADAERSARAHAERDAVAAALTAAYGLGGHVRRTGHPAERARTAVTARVRDAIRRIGRVHPALGGHLRRSVRTGTFCSYEPDEPVHWVQ